MPTLSTHNLDNDSNRPAAAGHAGPKRVENGAFASDPGWAEAWWWLGAPAALAAFLIAAHAVAPDWYTAHILPEGYGFLELGHFLMPLAGFAIAMSLLFRPSLRGQPLALTVAGLGAVACLYIAGEEMSWGQHFFNWQTPDYWAEINKQQETNLHNTLHVFDKTPRLLLELGVMGGGLLVPLLARYFSWVRDNRFALLLPADALVPTALGAVLFKLMATLEKEAGIAPLVARPSEATESFLYLFMLFYLIILARRLRELERR